MTTQSKAQVQLKKEVAEGSLQKGQVKHPMTRQTTDDYTKQGPSASATVEQDKASITNTLTTQGKAHVQASNDNTDTR